jgi:hypothetical protein
VNKGYSKGKRIKDKRTSFRDRLREITTFRESLAKDKGKGIKNEMKGGRITAKNNTERFGVCDLALMFRTMLTKIPFNSARFLFDCVYFSPLNQSRLGQQFQPVFALLQFLQRGV